MTREEFGDIYEQYVGALFTHAYFRVSDREKAKDLVQDTFVKAWETSQNIKYKIENRKDGEPEARHVENWKAFLYTILNNSIIDHYRTKKGKDVSLDMLEGAGGDDEGRGGEFGGHVPDGLKTGGLEVEGERFDQAVTSTVVREALGQLGEPDRTLVTLRYLQDETTAVVGQMLGMTENTVYVRSHRALQKLKKILGTMNI